MSKDDEYIAELEARVEELWHDRNLAWDKGYNQGRTSWHKTIVALQNRVEELTAELEYWKGRTENGSNAQHWPEFGPSGG